jgi:hypothetical protein
MVGSQSGLFFGKMNNLYHPPERLSSALILQNFDAKVLSAKVSFLRY